MKDNLKISYSITVCSELLEIQRLIPFLIENKREQDEIVILFDEKNGTDEVFDYIKSHVLNCRVFCEKFEGHFGDWKNLLTSHCKGDYIVNIDADEIPHINLIQNLPAILETNDSVDMIRVPRVNTVEGLTQDHINKWGWNVNEKGWVNWADWQSRIYRNTPSIKWVNRVHEILEGYKKNAYLPQEEEWALYHPKTIERQEKQNNYYNTL